MTDRTYPQGVPCWVDTEQQDVDAALEFYGGLFGWTFDEAAPPDAPFRYVIAKLGGRDVAGLGSQSTDTSPAWNTYIAVDDVDASAATCESLGARLLGPAADAGEGGRNAFLTDPTGAPFRLWQARRRLGAQAVNEPGAWNFSHYHGPDVAVAERFYTAAFGWVLGDAGGPRMARVPGYGDHLEATVDPDIRTRQQEAHTPAGFEDVVGGFEEHGGLARWHVLFSVADRDDSAATAERLGGTIVSTTETGWTREALIRDPAGAELTLSQFTPPDL